MARGYATKKTRSLRGETVQAKVHLPRPHRKFLLALIEACICEGIPLYIGKEYSSGKLPYKVFSEREVLESFIEPSDDAAAVIRDIAHELFDTQLVSEILEQGARLEAQERLRAAQTGGAEGEPRIKRSTP